MNAGTGRQLRVDVLGPLVVSVDGRPVDVTAGRLRAMVAMLALSAGEDVSVEVMLRLPERSEAAGAVTLRARAWDNAGNEVSQTIDRAYGLR